MQNNASLSNSSSKAGTGSCLSVFGKGQTCAKSQWSTRLGADWRNRVSIPLDTSRVLQCRSVAVSGCSADLVRTIEGVQCCFRFEQVSLAGMLYKPSYSVFARIDFSSVVEGLMVSLGGFLTENWILDSPELSQDKFSSGLYQYTRLIPIFWFMQFHQASWMLKPCLCSAENSSAV